MKEKEGKLRGAIMCQRESMVLLSSRGPRLSVRRNETATCDCFFRSQLLASLSRNNIVLCCSVNLVYCMPALLAFSVYLLKVVQLSREHLLLFVYYVFSRHRVHGRLLVFTLFVVVISFCFVLFDFCWSSGALEQLSVLQAALR